MDLPEDPTQLNSRVVTVGRDQRKFEGQYEKYVVVGPKEYHRFTYVVKVGNECVIDLPLSLYKKRGSSRNFFESRQEWVSLTQSTTMNWLRETDLLQLTESNRLVSYEYPRHHHPSGIEWVYRLCVTPTHTSPIIHRQSEIKSYYFVRTDHKHPHTPSPISTSSFNRFSPSSKGFVFVLSLTRDPTPDISSY